MTCRNDRRSRRAGRRRLLLLALPAALAALTVSAPAKADGCTMTMTGVTFTSVNPVNNADAFANGTGSVSCSWNLLSATFPYILLFPKVAVCIAAGPGSGSLSLAPRTLGAAPSKLNYNLYTDAGYATVWGNVNGTNPTMLRYNLTAPNILTGGTLPPVPFTIFGKVASGTELASFLTASDSSTDLDSTVSGTLRYAFYNLVAPDACTTGTTVAFSFVVKATVVNDCKITATPLAFPQAGVLNAVRTASGSLSIHCNNGNHWRIALNGGTAGTMAQRKMKHVSNSDVIAYELSDASGGPIWGDGSSGTHMVSGVGTGAPQTVTLYGRVPIQSTPRSGDYKDTIMAEIYF